MTGPDPNRPYRDLSDEELDRLRGEYEDYLSDPHSIVQDLIAEYRGEIDAELAHRQRERAGKAEG